MRRESLHSRFTQIVPQTTRNFHVLIAGAGMVGSWTALALARMVGQVDIWDFDVVAEENVGVQAYTASNVGMNKATALMLDNGHGLPLTGHSGRFDPYDVKDGPPADIVISAVDSMEGRSVAAMFAKAIGASYFIDTRVLGEIACIHPVLLGDIQDYIDTLPIGDELVSAACGAKGTAFAGMWVASQVCAIVNNIGRGLPLPPKIVWHVGMNQSVAPS